MLTRRAKAYSSSCQFIFSHFTAVHSWILSYSQKSQKSIKTPYFESLGSFKVIDVNTTEKLVTFLLWQAACPCLSATVFTTVHERLANNGKITTFIRGYRSLMPSCAGFLKPKKSRLRPSKSTFNARNFTLSFSMPISIGLGTIHSWNVSQPKIAKKIHKNPYFCI